jgi:hypothetical protein
MRYIILLILLTSCVTQETFVNRTMIPSDELEFRLMLSESEFAKVQRRFEREGYVLNYKRKGLTKFEVYLSVQQVEATVKGKGKRSVLPRRLDDRIRKVINDEIQ